jgi:hypothetical protein
MTEWGDILDSKINIYNQLLASYSIKYNEMKSEKKRSHHKETHTWHECVKVWQYLMKVGCSTLLYVFQT